MSQPAQPRWGFTSLFDHVPHPHVEARKEAGPVKVADQHKRSNWYSRVNARIAIWVTVGVGSMTCAWLFAALAIAGLPTALKPGNIGFLFWFSSDLLQLTLLSVIIVGQNIQAQAADKRAEQTYLDAEAVLHEAQQIQAHLAAQDAALTGLAGQLQDLVTAQAALLPGAAAAERVVPSRARKANGGETP
jgi:hypothetical protein